MKTSPEQVNSTTTIGYVALVVWAIVLIGYVTNVLYSHYARPWRAERRRRERIERTWL